MHIHLLLAAAAALTSSPASLAEARLYTSRGVDERLLHLEAEPDPDPDLKLLLERSAASKIEIDTFKKKKKNTGVSGYVTNVESGDDRDEPTPIETSVQKTTCEALRCCDAPTPTDAAKAESIKVEASPDSTPPATNAGLPPPISNEGPYPVRQKAVLPGLDETTAPVHHDYYAGYLDAGVPPSGRGRLYLHYICTMTPGKEGVSWRNMPMTLWYNGGPGAPSTFGLFQEFGPYLLTSESMRTESYRKTGIPTPMYNPWTWANVTSICEIDSPAPMGASFCTEGNGTDGSMGGPAGDPYSCGPWTDDTVAVANHRAYKSFFRDAFPEFETSQQPVSIVGESYAGVYVPLFVDKWLDDPLTGPNGIPINFAGFSVGDGFPGCIPTEGKSVDWCVNLNNVGFFDYPNALPGPFWDIDFFHGHSQMSESLYREIMVACPPDELKGIVMPLSTGCQKVIERMKREVGLFHVYNLLEACPSQDDMRDDDNVDTVKAAASVETHGNVAHPRRMLAGNAHKNMPSYRRHRRLATSSPQLVPSPGDGDTGLGAPCLGNAMDSYFSLDVVKRGLGIPLDNNFIVLDNGIGFNYTTTASFVGPIYAKAIKAGLRILVYEGDTDACGLQTAPIEDVWVPFFGSGDGEWTPMGSLGGAAAPLGLPMTGPWRPFSVKPGPAGVQGGYTIEWNRGQVSFVSIRGAGHLAPLYRPAASFTVMDAFQSGISLPDGPR